MKLFSRNNNKNMKFANLEKEVEDKRGMISEKLETCISDFKFINGDDRVIYNKVLEMLKFSSSAIKDLTILVSEVELDYLKCIEECIDIINDKKYDVLGIMSQNGSYIESSKGKAVKEIYFKVWCWIHL